MRPSLPVVLLLLTSSLAAQPVPLSTPTFGPAVNLQWSPAVAASPDGKTFLLWNDMRSGYGTSIFGSAVSEDDALENPRGVHLLGALDDELLGISRPSLVWDGAGFVALATEQYMTITARRIDERGSAIGNPVVLTDHTYSGGRCPAVSNGVTTLVTASDLSSDRALLVIDHDFRVIKSMGWKAIGVNGLGSSAMATDGRDYLITGRAASGSVLFWRAARLDSSGEIKSTISLPADPLMKGIGAALVWTRSGYLYIWTEYYRSTASPLPARIAALRLDADGKPVGSIVTLIESERANAIVAALDRSGRVLVAFARDTNKEADVFTFFTDGTTATTPLRISRTVSGDPWDPTMSIAGSRSATVLAWQTETGIQVRHLAADGSIAIAPSAVEQTESAVEQRRFAVDRHGVAKIAAWEERDGSNIERLVVAPIDADGRATSAPHVPFPSTRRQVLPAITSNGKTHLLAWFEVLGSGISELLAARVDNTGTPVDKTPMDLGEAFVYSDSADFRAVLEPSDAPPALIWDGTAYIVVRTSPDLHLRLTRITADGVVLDREGSVVAGPIRGEGQWKPVLAAAAGVTFLVWQEGSPTRFCLIECVALPAAIIRASRYGPGGLPMDSQPFIASTEDYDSNPDAASDGVRVLVTWNHEGTIRARRFLRDGTAFDRDAMTVGNVVAYGRPSVVFDSGRFVIAWEFGIWYASSSKPLQDIARGFVEGDRVVSAMLSTTRDRAQPMAWRSVTGAKVTFQLYSAVETYGVGRLYTTPADSLLVKRRAVRR